MGSGSSEPLPWFSGHDIASLVSTSGAIAAIENALKHGQDPSAHPPRSVVDTAHGQLLLMPAESKSALGVKIASVVPANPTRGLPRIQAIYLLLDSETMTPQALLDGTALTLLRTAAVSAVAAKYLVAKDATHLLVFGSGPQARAHIDAMTSIRSIEHVSIVGTTQPKAEVLAEYVAGLGISNSVILAGEVARVADAVASADLIVCATTSPTPLFDGNHVLNDACIVAIGSHEPRVREVDGRLVARSRVVVEERSTALRESGDIILAIEEGLFDAASLVSLAELVNEPEKFIDPGRPSLFKSSGMAWEDLAVAELVFHNDHRPATFAEGR